MGNITDCPSFTTVQQLDICMSLYAEATHISQSNSYKARPSSTERDSMNQMECLSVVLLY
jgi:hypothetical protein